MSKTYSIQIEYRTGDSERTEDASDSVGCSWTDLAKAKDALQRIAAHYRLYLAADDARTQIQHKEIESEAKTQPWFVAECAGSWRYGLIVEKDDGTAQRISAFWCGHFERLESAEIIEEELPGDTDMKVTF